MAIGNSYPVRPVIQAQDLFLGTRYGSNSTVNYTTDAIVDYLNTNASIAVGGQLTFQFLISTYGPKSIFFSAGGGDGTSFSSITQLIISSTDCSGSLTNIFVNYLVGKDILLSQQNTPNSFAQYKITSYTVTATPGFYTLNLQYIGGNGNIGKDLYYTISQFFVNDIPLVPTLQSVTDAGNTTTNNILVTDLIGDSYSIINNGFIGSFDVQGGTYSKLYSDGFLGLNYNGITESYLAPGPTQITLNFPNKPIGTYTIATTSDIPSLTGYVQDTRTISTSAPLSGGGDLSANRTLSITQATTSTDGYLSSTNWNTFNNKFTLPALTSGSVLFSNGTTIAQDNSNLFWDDTNNRLGIGTATPTTALDVVGGDARINTIRIGLGGGNVADNTALGASALNVNTSGSGNTAISYFALAANITGSNNTAVGSYALRNSTQSNNTAIGYTSFLNLSSGSNNTALGRNSARYIADGSTSLTIANQSVFIGTETKALADSQTNQIVIGYNAIGLGSNSVVLGNDSITKTALKGNVLINTTTDAGYKLDVNGTARVSGTTNNLTITNQGGVTPSLLLEADRSGWYQSISIKGGTTVLSTKTLLLGQYDNGNALIFNQSAADIIFSTDSTERFRLKNSGNVLINTTTDAGYKLDVNGTARVSGVLTVVGNILPSAGGTYNVGSAGVPFSNGFFINTVYSNQFASYNSHLYFANSGVNFARITNTTGNFIIQNGGTFTDAGYRLDVNGTARVSGDCFLSTSSGNVGIGTTSSSYKLTIAQDGYNLRLANTPNSQGYNIGRNVSDGILYFYGEQSGFNGYAFTGINGERMRVATSGNILINTTTDAGFKLDVNGTARVSGTSANPFIVERSTALSNIYIQYKNATASWFAGRTDAGTFGIGTNVALGSDTLFNLTPYGNLLLGTTTNVASSKLTIESTTQGFLPPRMTTTQKNAIATPAAGLVVYDTTDNKHYGYNGTTWNAFY